ncbi:hypothetical protein HMPREF0581_1088 [Mogibacterium timidum ATCC 33093]|uniref:Uncharacterized protein n=1 Tax=Mogibacterium timidum ATCC 33093 TaxID=1401079 RepID=X8ITF4_9FIRM|nr:hypothetical protein HMPREF0581_1088 [Mogibacterium timidum ATCC 33093]
MRILQMNKMKYKLCFIFHIKCAFIAYIIDDIFRNIADIL